jgi:hypothetical protein
MAKRREAVTERGVFAVDCEDVARFPVGQSVDDRDRHGEPVKGRIIAVKPGNKVALVIVETDGEA